MTFSTALGNTLTPLTDDHIIHPSQDATFEQQKGPAAGTRFIARLHQIAGAVTNHRAADATEIGEHKLALFIVVDRRACWHGIDYFRDKFFFVDMHRLGLELALKPECAYFGGAGVIEAASRPRPLQSFFWCWGYSLQARRREW